MDIPNVSGLGEEYRSLEDKLANVTSNNRRELLLTFPLATMNRDEACMQEPSIECQYDEITAICPWTDFPDQGSLHISYRPAQTLLELKSLKYYLLSFRQEHISQEHLAQLIYADLKVKLKPISLYVSLDYMPRGGIHTVITLK